MSKPSEVLTAIVDAYRRCASDSRPVASVPFGTMLDRCTESKRRVYAFLRKPENCAALAAALGVKTVEYMAGEYFASGAGPFGRHGGMFKGKGRYRHPAIVIRN